MAIPYIPYNGPVITRAEAKAAGQTRYFTGQPCKHGHLSQRATSHGACVVCHNESGGAWKAGNRVYVLDASRDYYERNRTAIRARVAARYAANPAPMKAYYDANAEKIKAQVKARRLANPDKDRADKEAWYAANKELVKQRVAEWNAAYPEATRCRKRNYRARFKGAEGSHTGDDIKALFVKQRGRCVYCNVKLGKGYHVDHIQPLAKGGSNWPGNLQLLCVKCNNRKRATDPIEFARRLGRLV